MTTEEPKFILSPTSLRDEVYQLLRQRILSHDYPPNFRFDLSALEVKLGISRTPLKEALQRLEAEGLVEIRPRRGTFVTSLDPQDVADSFDVRRILECAAAEMLVPHLTDDNIQELEALNNQMNALLEEADYQSILKDYLDTDREFHRLFVQMAGNTRLSAIHSQVNTHLHIARVRVMFKREDSFVTQSEHRAILAALHSRDGVALSQAMFIHIESAKVRILEVLVHE